MVAIVGRTTNKIIAPHSGSPDRKSATLCFPWREDSQLLQASSA
jgi:hypothetical protein